LTQLLLLRYQLLSDGLDGGYLTYTFRNPHGSNFVLHIDPVEESFLLSSLRIELKGDLKRLQTLGYFRWKKW
jgi:hypothetical protein